MDSVNVYLVNTLLPLQTLPVPDIKEKHCILCIFLHSSGEYFTTIRNKIAPDINENIAFYGFCQYLSCEFINTIENITSARYQ